MSQYRHNLPQLNGRPFLTDGGLETTLVFHDGYELPHFAAFDLLKDEAGFQRLREYYAQYAQIAVDQGTGMVLEAPTWRANPDWAAKLGYNAATLADGQRRGHQRIRRQPQSHWPAARNSRRIRNTIVADDHQWQPRPAR